MAYSKPLEPFGEGENSEHVLPIHLDPSRHPSKDDFAILTSGTTVNAKAVRQLPPDTVFLGWVGLDYDQVTFHRRRSLLSKNICRSDQSTPCVTNHFSQCDKGCMALN